MRAIVAILPSSQKSPPAQHPASCYKAEGQSLRTVQSTEDRTCSTRKTSSLPNRNDLQITMKTGSSVAQPCRQYARWRPGFDSHLWSYAMSLPFLFSKPEKAPKKPIKQIKKTTTWKQDQNYNPMWSKCQQDKDKRWNKSNILTWKRVQQKVMLILF